MRFQIMSDLHFEFWRKPVDIPIQKDIDLLVLAGDIVTSHNFCNSRLRLLKWLEDRPDLKVVLIPGNHEFYHGDFDTTVEVLKAELPNIRILDNEYRVYGDVAVIGSTLFTPLSNPLDEISVRRGLTDFRVVKGISVKAWQERNAEADAFIRKGLDLARNSGITKTVVITHFTPSYQSEAPCYRGSSISAGFHNNYDEFLEEGFGPDVWIHGHTHDSYDYYIGKTKILCNPLGYVNTLDQNKDFNHALLLEI